MKMNWCLKFWGVMCAVFFLVGAFAAYISGLNGLTFEQAYGVAVLAGVAIVNVVNSIWGIFTVRSYRRSVDEYLSAVS